MGRLIRVGGGVTRGGQWESGPHEWAGAGPTTSTLVAVPPVADPLGPPSTSTVGDVFPALTPPHHLAGYNHDRPEGRRGGLRLNLNNNTRSHGTMSSGDGRRGRERKKRPGFQAPLSIVPSAQQQLPASPSPAEMPRGEIPTQRSAWTDGRLSLVTADRRERACIPRIPPASLPASKGRTGHRANGGGRADEARIG